MSVNLPPTRFAPNSDNPTPLLIEDKNQGNSLGWGKHRLWPAVLPSFSGFLISISTSMVQVNLLPSYKIKKGENGKLASLKISRHALRLVNYFIFQEIQLWPCPWSGRSTRARSAAFIHVRASKRKRDSRYLAQCIQLYPLNGTPEPVSISLIG